MKKLFVLILLLTGYVSAFSINDIMFWKLVRSTDVGYTNKVSNVQLNVEVATRITADSNLSGDISTLGDVTNSYVVVNGVKLLFVGFNETRPNYYNEDSQDYFIFNSGSWFKGDDLPFGSLLYSNPSQSYLPPITGWLLNGVATNLNIQFFPGTDAQQQVQLTTKVSSSSGVASNLTIAGTTYFYVDGALAGWRGYTNSVAGLTTNRCRVEGIVRPNGVTNIYYSLYQ